MARATYRVVHKTHYEYARAVISSRQLAHLTPRPTPWQAVYSHVVHIDPRPGERTEGKDYFGNDVLRFAIDGTHKELTVCSESVVEVESYAPTIDAGSPAWEYVRDWSANRMANGDLDVAQYLVESPMVPLLPKAVEYAQPIFWPGRPWLEAIVELTRRIQTDFVYDPTATTITTPVLEVLGHRRGVCQDFAHLMISCLRSLGLSTRYVSGYILNRPPEGDGCLQGADASHAWVATCCPDLGWLAFDPTNGKLADIEFITVSWGRDFLDVTPLRGIVLGSGDQELTVEVSVLPINLASR